jgi:hypothetical protein
MAMITILMFTVAALVLFGTGVICGYVVCLMQTGLSLMPLKVQNKVQSSESNSPAQKITPTHCKKERIAASSPDIDVLEVEQIVVFTRLGKRFHISRNCHGLESRNQKFALKGSTRSDAIGRDYTPCSICGI